MVVVLVFISLHIWKRITRLVSKTGSSLVFLVLHAVSFVRLCVNFPHRNHRLPRRCPRRSYHKSHCPRRNRRRHLLPFHLRAYYRASFLRADQRHLWIERLKSEGRRRRRWWGWGVTNRQRLKKNLAASARYVRSLRGEIYKKKRTVFDIAAVNNVVIKAS